MDLPYIAIDPTLYELTTAELVNSSYDEAITLLERALSIKDAHPSDTSHPSPSPYFFVFVSALTFHPPHISQRSLTASTVR